MAMRVPPMELLSLTHTAGLRAIEESGRARCQVDGELLARHARCRECGLLIGPGHVERVSHGGYCGSCAKLVAPVVRSTRGR